MHVTEGAARRRVGALIAVLLFLGGCGGGGSSTTSTDAAPLPTTSETTPPTDVSVTLPAGPCQLGEPATEVTFGAGDRFYAISPDGGPIACRGGIPEPGSAVAWGAAADRALVLGWSVLLADKGVPVTPEVAVLSRPTGTATLGLSRGSDPRLVRTPLGAPAEDITFVERTEEAIYHPAGRHVMAVGELDGRYGIFMATNRGTEPREVALGESAERIHHLSFASSGDLLFLADHDGSTHVHRLDLDALELATEAESTEPLADLVASPFTDAVAWREGDCDVRFTVDRGPARMMTGAGSPVGWLPGGRLVTGPNPACAGAEPVAITSVQDVGGGSARVVAAPTTVLWPGNAEWAAVRAVLPPPPQPPAAAPANAAPA